MFTACDSSNIKILYSCLTEEGVFHDCSTRQHELSYPYVSPGEGNITSENVDDIITSTILVVRNRQLFLNHSNIRLRSSLF